MSSLCSATPTHGHGGGHGGQPTQHSAAQPSFSLTHGEEARATQGTSAPRYGGPGWSTCDASQPKFAKGATLLDLAGVGAQASHPPAQLRDGQQGDARDMGVMAMRLPPLSESLSRLNKTL